MFGPLGVPEILFILVLALLIFGPRRLPEVGRTLGKAMGEFRRATTELKRSINTEIALEDDDERPRYTRTARAEGEVEEGRRLEEERNGEEREGHERGAGGGKAGRPAASAGAVAAVGGAGTGGSEAGRDEGDDASVRAEDPGAAGGDIPRATSALPGTVARGASGPVEEGAETERRAGRETVEPGDDGGSDGSESAGGDDPGEPGSA